MKEKDTSICFNMGEPRPVYPTADKLRAWIIAKQREKGRAKYPGPLMTHSCGDPLIHAMEENADESNYLAAAWMEREEMRQQLAAARIRIEQLKREVCRLSLRVGP